jgi:adenylate cyclase
MITGKTTSRRKRYTQGLLGLALFLVIFLPLLLGGWFQRVEYQGLDWLQQAFANREKVRSDIVILYIDQKSIDFFQKSRGIGWPWPRDAYGLVVEYLKRAGARAVIFDAIFSEPSVFVNDYNDDAAFAGAMESSGRVLQTLVLHREIKGGAPTDDERMSALLNRGLDYEHVAGPKPIEFKDVTMPIPPLMDAAWGLGVINIRPEDDGVVRRLTPLEGLRGAVFPTLSLAAFIKLNQVDKVVQDRQSLRVGPAVIPLDDEGRALIKYYGGLGTYKDYTMAAVIQSGVDVLSDRDPMLPLESFKDKIIFIGAKAASLYDLRSTPMDDALPGVEIHATFLNNLLANDHLRPAPDWVRVLLVALLLWATLSASLLARNVWAGAAALVGLGVCYIGGAVVLYQHNMWLYLVTPLGAQGFVFIMATLINYYGEGREKSAVRSAFSRYLSPDVVEVVLHDPDMLSLGGSRRVMTCFFSDLAGFTTISEALSPEDLVQLLNRYLSIMTRVILRHGGTVDKFEGDAIMAFWGAPLIQEDHARRACMAALEQQAEMDKFRAWALSEGLPELHVRMGLNTGPMIVGNMGSEERFDYTVMGDSVNLASRLEGANKAYGSYIMISESTYSEVEDHVEVRELDLLRVKGKQEPIRVFELMAATGELSKEKKELRQEYEKGLSLYRAMDFEKAEVAFETALAMSPDDGPSRVYMERCRAYQQAPPPPDWDRVFTMTSK